MRLVASLLCLCALAGCGDRRSFDERYNDTSAKLEQRARALDDKLQNEAVDEEPTRNANGA